MKTIRPEDLETWASYLLNHSLGGIGAEDRVMLKAEPIAWPLVEVLERKIIEAGGIPDVYLFAPNNDRGRVWSAAMAKLGTAEQLSRIPDWHLARYESMTKYIEILGFSDSSAFTGVPPAQAQAALAADRPFSTIRLSKPWVLTLYPTQAGAQAEGMSFETYTDFIVRASTTDPSPLRVAEEALAPLFERGKQIRIESEHPVERRPLSLSMDISQSIPTLSYGLRNFPDGEIFTSPNANSVEGEIFVDLPVSYGGHELQGIYLRFEGGRIVSYDALQGREHLATIIETDEGSHRLGEVALGMNPGLEKVLKNPLFVEKVGGTLHIAIGASYEGCYVAEPGSEEGKAKLEALRAAGVLNQSAQHVDIVCDFRPGGAGRRVFIDEQELVVCDKLWCLPHD